MGEHPGDDSAPAVEPLVDGYGRVVTDLRVSVTDRCNFRCVYCMPAEGLAWLPRQEILTFEEIERLAWLFVSRLGVRSVRLTGGEPTVRAHLPDLVARIAATGVELALTTNGATLRALAGPLAAAGLQRVNISLDSLDRGRFVELARRDELDAVLDGIDAAREAGLHPVKINVVLVRGINDDEILDFASFGRERGVGVRFIEYMPLDADDEWSLEQVVPSAEVLEAIGAVFPLEAVEPEGGPDGAAAAAEPAARYRYRDGRGEVGVIASVTQPFCGSCDRVRITADGRFRTCLFALDETDLRGPLRDGASDDELEGLVRAAVAVKWAGHLIGQPVFVRPTRSMSQIGG